MLKMRDILPDLLPLTAMWLYIGMLCTLIVIGVGLPYFTP